VLPGESLLGTAHKSIVVLPESWVSDEEIKLNGIELRYNNENSLNIYKHINIFRDILCDRMFHCSNRMSSPSTGALQTAQID